MKKANCKRIRMLASKMPKSYEKGTHTTGTKGSNLSEDDKKFVTERDGSYDPSKTYLKKETSFVIINHYKRMKKAYVKKGNRGIMDYIKWVNINNVKLNEEFHGLDLEEVNPGIMELTKGKAKDFWKNLISFIMSFMAFFGEQNEEA